MVTKFEKSEVSFSEMLLRYTGNGEKNYLIDFLLTLKHKKRKEIHEIVCSCGSNNMIFPYLSKSPFFVRVSLKLLHLF